MNDQFEATTNSILAGVRDNLLKPMAREIEQNQHDCFENLTCAIAELKSALESKIADLENKIADLEKFQH